MNEYKFVVETKEAGQRNPYGDSFYHYIIESDCQLHTIEAFCKKVLKPSIPASQYNEEDKGYCADHFRSYCTEYIVLQKPPPLEAGLTKVSYKVTSPSTH